MSLGLALLTTKSLAAPNAFFGREIVDEIDPRIYDLEPVAHSDFGFVGERRSGFDGDSAPAAPAFHFNPAFFNDEVDDDDLQLALAPLNQRFGPPSFDFVPPQGFGGQGRFRRSAEAEPIFGSPDPQEKQHRFRVRRVKLCYGYYC